MADKVIVIGGGAAGLLAAGTAAELGAEVELLEKNDILAKKLRISGKGRCNLTNAMPIAEFIACYPGNGKFLYSALARFTNQDLIEFVARYGVSVKIERGQRVFPESDNAHQVAEALISYAKEHGVEFRTNTKAVKLCVSGRIEGVKTNTGFYKANKVIIATGGKLSRDRLTGDGYDWLQLLGIRS